MTDFIDRAQALDEMQRENAIARHKAKQAKALVADNGSDECEDCGEDISARRKLRPANRCASCQTKADKMALIRGHR
jgi:RNA polymerase-binding transcription factor DksA